MNEQDKIFLDDMAYFWRNKKDMERCTSFDRDRLFKLDPMLLLAWDNYCLAKTTLNHLTSND